MDRLRRAAELPAFLLALREIAAAVAGTAPARLQQVLVTEYAVGAGIGWHRDKAVFGDVVGISLGAPCRRRLRRAGGLRGPARSEWEHSIPAVDALRYSVTFRSLRAAG